MKQAFKSLAKRAPFIKDLWEKIRKQGAFPAGHYYSPIPSREEVLSYVETRAQPTNNLLGINLNEKSQRETLDEYISYYHELPFPEIKTSGYRYYYENGWFSYSDAIFLYSFLRKHMPKRIIEIGSGFSSAVILDTIEVFFSQKPDVTFIEPFPDRLLSLLEDRDKPKIKLLEKKVQDVPIENFLSLESGDLLFIDSSHVVKCGSDLHFIFFEVLPRLKPGVFVHFHDVFFPFDYPSESLIEGIFWNENYFLRAFLSYNSEWSIQFFNTYVHFMFGDYIKNTMPLCVKNQGASLYIQRKENG